MSAACYRDRNLETRIRLNVPRGCRQITEAEDRTLGEVEEEGGVELEVIEWIGKRRRLHEKPSPLKTDTRYGKNV